MPTANQVACAARIWTTFVTDKPNLCFACVRAPARAREKGSVTVFFLFIYLFICARMCVCVCAYPCHSVSSLLYYMD